MNPHFLYNTLDSIMWMIESERYEDAVAMVNSLGKLLRISLSKGKNIITVGDELQHARSYLDIQKYRYKNKFTSFFDIEEGIEKYRTIQIDHSAAFGECDLLWNGVHGWRGRDTYTCIYKR